MGGGSVMKRLLVSASVAMFLLSGCQWIPESSSSKPVVTLWYWNRSLSDDVIQKARDAFPDVEIVAQKIGGGEYKTKLHTALIAGRGPDIVAMNDWPTSMWRILKSLLIFLIMERER